MQGWASDDEVRFAIASDVGGIELIYARFRNYSIPRHVHSEYSISVSLKGGLSFEHRGSKHTAPAGVISALDPGEPHNAYPAGDRGWAFACLLVPLDVVREMALEVAGREMLPGIPKRIIDDGELAPLLVKLHAQLETAPDPLERSSAALSTLAMFFRRHSTMRSGAARVYPQRDATKRARTLLRESYAGQTSLKQLAACAGLSPFYFLRTFRAETGLSPHAFLNHVRVQEAKRRLAAGECLAQVALECGFYDQSHLARVFRGIVGMAPSQYRGLFHRMSLSLPQTAAGISQTPTAGALCLPS
jgi:AraC-like DNA-binding protein